MESLDLAKKIRSILQNKNAREVEILEVGMKTTLADCFVLASGTSNTHVRALADEVEYRLEQDEGILPRSIEGLSSGHWILLDYSDVIVHIFREEDRQYYGLEHFWQLQPRQVSETTEQP